MARTIAEIQAEIVALVQGDTVLAGASSTSQTAIWRLITRVVASAFWALEVIFDAFTIDLLAQVEALKPHTLRWYQSKALLFQNGSDLPDGSDDYDNSALDDATVLAQQIVRAAAATEGGGKVQIKVAKETSGALAPLSGGEYASFTSYMNKIKDAGVVIETVNQNGDKLTVAATIYYDPLVLNSSGNRIDGTLNDPVGVAVKAYLRALPFNGALVRSALFDVLQAVSGVYTPVLTTVQAGVSSATALGEVQVQYIPFAGYFKLSTLVLTFTYVSKDTL